MDGNVAIGLEVLDRLLPGAQAGDCGLQFFFTSTPHHRVDHILLAGGAASLPGLVDAVAAQCAFPSSLVNPFEGMGVAASVRERGFKREAAAFLTACGLALRRFTT